MEKLKKGFFTNGHFSLGEDGEIDTNRFCEDSNELANSIDKVLDKHDDHPVIDYTGNNYRYFRNFKGVDRSEHGRSANEFNNIQEYKGINWYLPGGNACFLKCNIFIFKKNFSIEYFEFIQLFKRKTKVMTRSKIQ